MKLTKVGHWGGHYALTYHGVAVEAWRSVYRTNTSRPAGRAAQRAGYASYASSRRDVMWSWRALGGPIVDGYASRRQALDSIVHWAAAGMGAWKISPQA